MSDHSIATRRYAFLTPGSFAAWARRSHSSALALCSWALDGISSGPRLAFPDRLNPLGADWFHSCDGLPVSFGTACALYGLRRKENASRFRTIQVSLRTCHSVGGKLKTAGKPTLLVMVARTREPGHALPEAAALHNAPRRCDGVATRGPRAAAASLLTGPPNRHGERTKTAIARSRACPPTMFASSRWL
jgi:hypothetical protein